MSRKSTHEMMFDPDVIVRVVPITLLDAMSKRYIGTLSEIVNVFETTRFAAIVILYVFAARFVMVKLLQVAATLTVSVNAVVWLFVSIIASSEVGKDDPLAPPLSRSNDSCRFNFQLTQQYLSVARTDNGNSSIKTMNIDFIARQCPM